MDLSRFDGWSSHLAGVNVGLTVSLLAVMLATLWLRRRNDVANRRLTALEARLTPQLLEVLAEARPPESLQTEIRRGDRLEFLGLLFSYSTRLRGREREVLGLLARPLRADLEPLLRHRAAGKRGYAIHLLSALLPAESGEAFEQALDDPSPLVSMLAARALCDPRHRERFPALFRRLNRFAAWSVFFLGRILAEGGEAIVPSLRDCLASGEYSPRVRAAAAEALRHLSDFAVAPVAVRILERDEDEDLLCSVLRLLARVARPEDLSAVRAECERRSGAVRATALDALARLGTVADEKCFLVAARDANPWTVLHATRGLVSLGATDALRALEAEEGIVAAFAREALRSGHR